MGNKKNILVTGAAGFIGSHFCEHLIKKGYQVIGYDNLITGNINNLSKCINNKNFKFINKDVRDSISINLPITYIVHLASPASPLAYNKFPLITLETGSLGTHNIFKLAKKKKSKILIASTSEIYGDPKSHPQDENYYGNVNPVGPRSMYDESKRYMEAYAINFYKKHKSIDLSIARIFNTYGPRMGIDDGRVIPNLITQALKNIDLTIYGDGRQTRSFCYINDMISALSKLLFLNKTFNQPINIGNIEEVSILNLSKEIISMTKSNSKINFMDPFDHDDPKKRKPDITRAKKILKWKPEISRNKGLIKTIDYFKKVVI